MDGYEGQTTHANTPTQKAEKKTNKQKQEDEQQRRTKDASIRQWKAKKVKS